MPDEVTLDYEPGVLRVLQTKSETKAFYDKIAKVYDLLSEHSERPMREAGLRLLAAAPGEHVLEIGFGTGHILAELADAVGPTGRVFGIDISENMLAHARDVLGNKGLMDRVSLDCGDAEKLPYGNDSMDGIFMCFTLELFDTPDIPKVLAECKRVLRPGGRVVVVAVSKEGKDGFVIHAFEWTHRHFPNLMDCRPIYARRALEATGFVVEDSSYGIHVGSRGDCEGQRSQVSSLVGWAQDGLSPTDALAQSLCTKSRNSVSRLAWGCYGCVAKWREPSGRGPARQPPRPPRPGHC